MLKTPVMFRQGRQRIVVSYIYTFHQVSQSIHDETTKKRGALFNLFISIPSFFTDIAAAATRHHQSPSHRREFRSLTLFNGKDGLLLQQYWNTLRWHSLPVNMRSLPPTSLASMRIYAYIISNNRYNRATIPPDRLSYGIEFACRRGELPSPHANRQMRRQVGRHHSGKNVPRRQADRSGQGKSIVSRGR